MNELFRITEEDIEKLNEYQLPHLLRRLLHLEAIDNKIPESAIDVSLQINIPDGGKDGSIKWEGDPNSTNYLLCNNIVFECKKRKKNPIPSSYASWVKNSRTGEIKPKIDEVHSQKGYYIIVLNRTEIDKTEKINAIREVYKDANKSYASTANIDIYDAQKLVEWTNKYIPAIILVKDFVHNTIPHGMKTVELWQQYKDLLNFKYIYGKDSEQHIQTIQKEVIHPQNIIRITGPSGIGKTRLAFEAFNREYAENNAVNMASIVVYIDSQIGSIHVKECIDTLIRGKIFGVLVVDNCEVNLEEWLINEIRRGDSKLSVVLIDSFPETQLSQGFGGIELEPFEDSIIIAILKQFLGENYPIDKLEFIASIVNGFPLLAVQLGNAQISNFADIEDSLGDKLIDNLISGNYPADKEAKKIMTVCSLFSQIGYLEKASEEFEYILNQLLSISGDIYDHIDKFKKRRIVEQYGHYIRTVPLPLAVWLAAKWWKKRPSNKIEEIISLPFPGQLLEALYERLSQIGYLREAKQIVEDLAGTKGPFGQSEVLLSERGSRLFRSIAHVNPTASIQSLNKIINVLSKEELFALTIPRRNWVWAIGDLLYFEPIYTKTIDILIKLSLSENENYTNNATGLLLQSFQVRGSGTGVKLSKRLAVIKKLLSEDETEAILAIGLMKNALKSRRFIQTFGLRNQDLNDNISEYKPQYPEIIEYWEGIISLLTDVIITRPKFSPNALDAIAENFDSVLVSEIFINVEERFRKIHKKGVNYWRALLQKIISIRQYELTKYSKDAMEFADKMFELFYPSKTVDHIDYSVLNPPYQDIERKDGTIVDLSKERAKLLGNTLANDNLNWSKYLPNVFKGMNRNSYVFGVGIAEKIENPIYFITFAMDMLNSIDSDNLNTSVIIGFLSGMKIKDNSFVNEFLDKVSKSEKLSKYLVDFTLSIMIQKADLHRLIYAINNFKLPPTAIMKLKYGSVLDHLPVINILEFIDQLRKDSQYNVVALEIIFMYSLYDEKRIKKCLSKMRELVLCINLNEMLEMDQGEIHQWQSVVERLLSNKKDNELAKFIINELLVILESHDRAISIDYIIKPIIKILLKEYRGITWDYISNIVLNDNHKAKRNIEWLLGSKAFSESDKGLLESLPEEFLLEWCEKYPKKAPLFITRRITLFENDGQKWVLTSLSRKLINLYGKNEELLEELTLNLHNFSWTGSMVGYYKKQVESLPELLDSEVKAVREWTQNTIRNAEKMIVKETMRDSERKIGIYGSPYD